jgi:hypothetical protein
MTTTVCPSSSGARGGRAAVVAVFINPSSTGTGVRVPQ